MTTHGAIRRATFAVSGLSGPDDGLELEGCLTACHGIRHVVVRWDIQAVKVEFDETIVSVQAIARHIANSDGGGRAEGLVARLLLKVPSVRIEEKARLPSHILRQLPGVESVAPQIAFQAVEVRFVNEGDLTTSDLIRALRSEGVIANLM
jgi:hypothetical protein